MDDEELRNRLKNIEAKQDEILDLLYEEGEEEEEQEEFKQHKFIREQARQEGAEQKAREIFDDIENEAFYTEGDRMRSWSQKEWNELKQKHLKGDEQ